MQATHYSETGSETEIYKLFQAVVGRPFEGLGTMVKSGSSDATSYCSQVAPISLSFVLAMEITFQVRSTSDIRGNAGSYPQIEY